MTPDGKDNDSSVGRRPPPRALSLPAPILHTHVADNKVATMGLAHEQETHRWITEGPGTIKRMIASYTSQQIQAFKKNQFQYHCNIKAIFILLQLIFL